MVLPIEGETGTEDSNIERLCYLSTYNVFLEEEDGFFDGIPLTGLSGQPRHSSENDRILLVH